MASTQLSTGCAHGTERNSLSREEEAAIVAFRQLTLLPLDDCLYALQSEIPHLSRSSLHRCFQRHGISRLPQTESEPRAKKKCKPCQIGYFHLDIAEVKTEEGRLYLFVAIDRVSKFAYAERHNRSTRFISRDFLHNLINVVPYKIHTVLTDNGIHFTHRPGTESYRVPPFDRLCYEKKIEHRLTTVCHPWTNGQVERMNRTLKEATVNQYHYQSHDQLKTHMHTFLMAYNFSKRLKALKGMTPYEFICKMWEEDPQRFKINPSHHNMGPYNYALLGTLPRGRKTPSRVDTNRQR